MSKQTLITFLVICGFALIVLLAIFVVLTKISRDKENQPSQALLSVKAEYSLLNNIFNVFNSIGPLKHFQDSIFNRYTIIYPNDERKCKDATVKVELAIFAFSIITVIFIALVTPNLYGLLLVLWITFIGSQELMASQFEGANLKILNQFAELVSQMRHAFVMNNMIDEALMSTYDKLPSLILPHAMQMHKILTADDQDEEIFKYSRVCPNKYMLQFLSICSITMKYGDRKVHGQSLFLLDIKDLKQSLDDELLSMKLRKNKFTALIPVCVFPVLAMGIIKDWVISSMPPLQRFYAGSTGVLLQILCFVISFVIYKWVNSMKRPSVADTADHVVLKMLVRRRPFSTFIKNYEYRYAYKTNKLNKLLKDVGSSFSTQTFLLYRLGLGITAFVVTFLFITALNINTKSLETHEFSDADYSFIKEQEDAAGFILTKYYVNQLKKEDLDAMCADYQVNIEDWEEDNVPDPKTAYFAQYIASNPPNLSDDEIIKGLQLYNSYFSEDSKLYISVLGTSGDFVLPEDPIEQFYVQDDITNITKLVNTPGEFYSLNEYCDIVEIIIKHIDKYQNATFKWFYALLMIIAAVSAYFFPYIKMQLKYNELQEVMEDEVIQFQGIIMILMHIDNMSVQTILEELSKFAKAFRESIQICIGNFASGEMDALEELYKAEPYEPFRRIVNNLMICDRIGIKAAFDETEVERKNYVEKRAQDRSLSLDKKATLASFVSMAPFMTVVVMYMVIPFLTESMNSMSAAMNAF